MKDPADPSPAARLTIIQEPYDADGPLEEPSPAATLTISLEPYEAASSARSSATPPC